MVRSMLSSRPFRALIAVLVAIGMHVCCCQLSLFGMSHGSPTDQADSRSCCDHEHHEPAEDPDRAPDSPEAPHACCGAHANAVTLQSGSFELPAFVLVELPAFLPARRIAIQAVEFPPVAEACPALDTALVKRHCALTV